MMKTGSYHLLLVTTTVWLAGCAHHTVFPEPSKEYQRASLADTTRQTIARDYLAEHRNGQLPKIGLALSGGGARAGLFAHGVLHGLHEAKLLPQVDIISSVSGGGYAAYWFYARHIEAHADRTDYAAAFADCRPDWWVPFDLGADDLGTIMRKGGLGSIPLAKLPPCPKGSNENLAWLPGDPYRWQAHLAWQADMFRPEPEVFNGTPGPGPWLQTLPLIVSSLIEMVFYPFVKDGALGGSYEKGIIRTWGLAPTSRAKAEDAFGFRDAIQLNDGSFTLQPGVHTWEALRETRRASETGQHKLPLWVVNTTVMAKGSVPNEDAIFEITPFSFGSRVSGYRPAGPGADVIPEIPRAVRASAAALDPHGFEWKSVRFGEYVGRRAPFAEWGVRINHNPFQADGAAFRLSDGGQSDNLGLISLVRRGVKDIILVDAEADGTGTFDGLCWDWTMLKNAGYEMQFDALQDFSAFCQNQAEYRSGPSEQKGWVRRAYNVSDWRNPVVPGSIVKRPGANGDPDFPPIRIWLIKLAWDQAQVQDSLTQQRCEEADPTAQNPRYPNSCFVTVFKGHQNTGKHTPYLVFPQLTTTGAAFNASAPLMWAFRELGRQAATQLKLTPDGLARHIDRGWPQVTQQPLLCFKDKHRAVPCSPSLAQ